MSRSSSTVSEVAAGLIQSWRGPQSSHQESVQIQRFYKRVQAFVLNFSQVSIFRTTQDLVRSDRNVWLCSGVIALEDSSCLASLSAWTLLDKMTNSFLSSLARPQVRLKGSSSNGWLCLHLQSFVFADSVLSWNTAHEALVHFVGEGPSMK